MQNVYILWCLTWNKTYNTKTNSWGCTVQTGNPKFNFSSSLQSKHLAQLKVQKIPFGAFSKAKFLVRANHDWCLQTLFKMIFFRNVQGCYSTVARKQLTRFITNNISSQHLLLNCPKSLFSSWWHAVFHFLKSATYRHINWHISRVYMYKWSDGK